MINQNKMIVIALILLVLLVCATIAILHYQAVARVKYYQSQGMTALPGFDTFFFGNRNILLKYRALMNSDKSKYFFRHPIYYYVRRIISIAQHAPVVLRLSQPRGRLGQL